MGVLRARLVDASLMPGEFAKARERAEVPGLLDRPPRIAEIQVGNSRDKPDTRDAFGFVT